MDELQEIRKAPERRAAEHPFVHKMLQGVATEDQVKVQCIQFYFHTVAFVNGLTRLASRCHIPDIQKDIAAGVYEEFTGKLTGTAPHLELYLRYAESWGFDYELLHDKGVYMLPETMALMNWYMYVADHLSPLEGVAVFNVAAEGANVTFPGLPGASNQIYRAVTEHYGRTHEDAFFWDLHDKADQEHSTTGVAVLARHVKTPDEMDRVRNAARMTSDAWFHFMGAPERWTVADCLSGNSSYFY